MPSSTKRTPIADIAVAHDTSARRARRIARKLGLGVGRGNRYQLTTVEKRKLEKAL